MVGFVPSTEEFRIYSNRQEKFRIRAILRAFQTACGFPIAGDRGKVHPQAVRVEADAPDPEKPPELHTTMNEANESETGPDKGRNHFETFAEALGAARKDAASKAREAAPKLKGALQGAAHDMAYGAAFGACFAACFAREMMPEGIKEAFRCGANDGRDAAQDAAEAATTPAPEAPPLPG